MVRIAARRHAALVVKLEAIRDGAAHDLVKQAMRAPRFPADRQDAIPMLVYACGPQPTAAVRFGRDLGHDPIENRRGLVNAAGHYSSEGIALKRRHVLPLPRRLASCARAESWRARVMRQTLRESPRSADHCR